MDKIGDEAMTTANGIKDIKNDMIRIFKDIGELKEDTSDFKNAMKEIAAMKEAQKEMKETGRTGKRNHRGDSQRKKQTKKYGR